MALIGLHHMDAERYRSAMDGIVSLQRKSRQKLHEIDTRAPLQNPDSLNGHCSPGECTEHGTMFCFYLLSTISFITELLLFQLWLHLTLGLN